MGVWLSLLIESLTDYYPFGMEMGGRSYKSNDYRFGYTGHEKENDLAEGVYTTQYRLLDTRLGRWMSVDPLFGKYPDMSAYNYCGGNPVALYDNDGSFVRITQGQENMAMDVLDDIFADFPATRNLFSIDNTTGLMSINRAGISPALAEAKKWITGLNISEEEKQVRLEAYCDIMTAFEKVISNVNTATVDFNPDGVKPFEGGKFQVTVGNIDVDNPSNGVVYLDNVNPGEELRYRKGSHPDNDFCEPVSLGELFCHELLGHAMGYFEKWSMAVDGISIHMSNH